MDEKYAILTISESWLNSSLKNAEGEIDGFSFQDWTGRETQRMSLVVGCVRTCARPRSLKYVKTYPEYQTLLFTNCGWKFSRKRPSHSCFASLTSLLIVMLPAF